ncbi:hypothetical protein Taro_015368, partial [Colocasia esculenta]|nr:hypothetical protein [Colocasia esculenta]
SLKPPISPDSARSVDLSVEKYPSLLISYHGLHSAIKSSFFKKETPLKRRCGGGRLPRCLRSGLWSLRRKNSAFSVQVFALCLCDPAKMSGNQPQEEDRKPADQSGSHINLKVKGQDGNEVFFRIKRSTQLRKLMNAYCERQSVDFQSIAFLFDGRRLRGEQTPDELEMEDGDEIDAMLHQTGGGLKHA